MRFALLASLLTSLLACSEKDTSSAVDTADTSAEVADADLDGFDSVDVGGTDCNDDDDTINPSKFDVVDDGVDNDCDGEVDNFRFNVIPYFKGNQINGIKYFMDGVPDGTSMLAMVYIPMEYTVWEEDPSRYVTFREGGFVSSVTAFSDGDPATYDAASDALYPNLYGFPGIEQRLGVLSIVLCSSDQTPLHSSGANCLVWGPTALDAVADMQNVIDASGMASYRTYKNGDPQGEAWEDPFTNAWNIAKMGSFTLELYEVPPVPESGM